MEVGSHVKAAVGRSLQPTVGIAVVGPEYRRLPGESQGADGNTEENEHPRWHYTETEFIFEDYLYHSVTKPT